MHKALTSIPFLLLLPLAITARAEERPPATNAPPPSSAPDLSATLSRAGDAVVLFAVLDLAEAIVS